MLDLLPTKLYGFKAINKDTLVDNIDFQVDKSSLPNMIYQKDWALADLITRKLDTQDGLVNSANGIFQMHTSNKEDILWNHFRDLTIGRSRRQKMERL